jgi:hypothetical protein
LSQASVRNGSGTLGRRKYAPLISSIGRWSRIIPSESSHQASITPAASTPKPTLSRTIRTRTSAVVAAAPADQATSSGRKTKAISSSETTWKRERPV